MGHRPGGRARLPRATARGRKQGKLRFSFRHRVDDLIVENGRVTGVRGSVLAPSDEDRGIASSREVIDAFEVRGIATVVATGGIGGNLDKVREMWPEDRWGPCPEDMVTGVPAHVDRRGIDIAAAADANLVNTDRMWHYPEGMTNWDSI